MVKLGLFGAGIGDLAHSVQDGGVVSSTEQVADLRQALLSQLLGQVHRHLARQGDIGRPAFRVHVGHLDLVEIGNRLLDVLDRDLAVGHRKQVLQGLLADIHRQHVAAMETRVGQHLAQGAFQLAYVAAQVLGDEERHFLGHRHAFGLGLAQQDRHAHLEFGRLDGHGQPGVEPRNQPAVDTRELLRVRIAGDDDLLALRHHRLERIEELLLRAILAGKELDIVDQQQIERMVVALEIVERLALVGLDHVRDVLVRMHVAHPHAGPRGHHGIADGVDQVGLAQPHAAVQEQRVVGRAGILRHLQRRGARQLVGLAGHEILEGEIRVQARPLVNDVRGVGACRRRRSRLRCLLHRSNDGRHRDRHRARHGHRYAWRGAGAGQLERHLHRALVPLGGQRLDLMGKVLPHPIQLEAIGRGHAQNRLRFVIRKRDQRSDPRADLLGEFLLKTTDAGLPEFFHVALVQTSILPCLGVGYPQAGKPRQCSVPLTV